MRNIHLGTNVNSGEDIMIPPDSFRTHYHLIGGTGKGKTTAIFTMIQQMMMDTTDNSCFFVIDKLGNFTSELLLWMSSEDYCTQRVRDRLVLIEAANEDFVVPLNPLLYRTEGQGFYKVERATEIILRGWESQKIEAM